MGAQGKAKVADQVAERVERLIVEGVLKVGQALPSERRLVEKLGCSRSALREGLRILLSLIHISEPTRQCCTSRMPSSA